MDYILFQCQPCRGFYSWTPFKMPTILLYVLDAIYMPPAQVKSTNSKEGGFTLEKEELKSKRRG